MIKGIVKWILPKKMYNFIRMRPRLMIVSLSVKDKIKKINSDAWRTDPDYRGDLYGAVRKYGHMVDKGLQIDMRESGRGELAANQLECYLKSTVSGNLSVVWANNIFSLYNELQKGNLEKSEYSSFEYVNSEKINSDQLLGFIKERNLGKIVSLH